MTELELLLFALRQLRTARLRDDRGALSFEMVLIVAAVSALALGAMAVIATKVMNKVNGVATE